MAEDRGERLDDMSETRLRHLEEALAHDQSWSGDDRAWLIAELRKAWTRLAEAQDFVPVDPSRIG